MSDRRNPEAREYALWAFALLGLCVSAVTLVDYIRPPVFCADHGVGCDAVRNSRFGRVFGVPLAIPGILYFASILGVSLTSAGERARRLLGSLGLLGALAGVTLIALQAAVIHHWCKFCLVVDVSSLATGALAMSLRASVTTAALDLRPRVGFGVAAVALAVCPIAYGLSLPVPVSAPIREATVPEVILREQRPGVATIVEFVDFECPHCRHQQEALAPVLASYGPRVRLVRRNVPLSFHQHARDAARAACCAEEQGRGERLAEVMFRTTPEELTPEGCERLAREAGVDVSAFQACMTSRRPEAALERDMNDAHAANVSGLPSLWVGREHFEGFTEPEALRASIDRALQSANAHSGT